ncbi:unannotated protein [freshwater metagenome]|uniref:Unannotated protein n=1 Tax=freshwater metagenome TaxID=449393 RepID=A0A6J7UN47_9ZZZZ
MPGGDSAIGRGAERGLELSSTYSGLGEGGAKCCGSHFGSGQLTVSSKWVHPYPGYSYPPHVAA